MARGSTCLDFSGHTEQAFEFCRSVCGGEFGDVLRPRRPWRWKPG